MNQENQKQEQKSMLSQNTDLSVKKENQIPVEAETKDTTYPTVQSSIIPSMNDSKKEETNSPTVEINPQKKPEASQNNINNNESIKEKSPDSESRKPFTAGQDITSRPPKYDPERMNNHIQNLIKEKKAHLKKIANLEDQVNQLRKDLSANNTRVPKTEKMIDIFSTAQENAEKYFDNIKNLADAEMAKAKKTAEETITNANQKAQKVLALAEKKALYIQEKASEQALELQKKNGIMMQETERYKSSIEAQLNEAKAKIETSENQANEKAERIIIKAKEDAANILTEANMKLELANKKHDQIIGRAEDQVEHIVSCARTEYEGLRSLIDKSSLQYIELCKDLSDFDYLYSFTETINSQPDEDDSETDSGETKEN